MLQSDEIVTWLEVIMIPKCSGTTISPRPVGRLGSRKDVDRLLIQVPIQARMYSFSNFCTDDTAEPMNMFTCRHARFPIGQYRQSRETSAGAGGASATSGLAIAVQQERVLGSRT